MPPIQTEKKLSDNANGPGHNYRVRQADRVEILAAAAEADGICTDWIADRFLDHGQVSP